MNDSTPIPETPVSGDATAEPRPARLLRRAILLGIVLVLFGSAATLVGVIRGRIQQAKVDALEPFSAFVYAHFGDYEYVPEVRVIQTSPPRSWTETVLQRNDDGSEEWVTVENYSSGTITFVGGGLRLPGFCVCDDPPRLIGWLVPLFGEHCFARVTSIEPLESFTDDDVPLVLAFPDLCELRLGHTELTDIGVRRLLSLEHLVVLDLWDRRLSEETLRLLPNCRQLRHLNLRGTRVRPEMLEYLQRSLPGCEIEHD